MLRSEASVLRDAESAVALVPVHRGDIGNRLRLRLWKQAKEQIAKIAALYYFLGYLEAHQLDPKGVEMHKERNLRMAKGIASDPSTAKMFKDSFTYLDNPLVLNCKTPSRRLYSDLVCV
jgi:hypothetical protein